MRSIAIIGVLGLAAAPLSAQSGKFRTGSIDPSNRGSVLGQVLGQDVQQQQQRQDANRKSDRVPPGQLPPAGMCRIWIDGVPPGQQPAPTDCQTAVATKPANARVLWGDQAAHPGKAKGKFNKNAKGKNKVKHQDRDRDRDDDDDDDDLDEIRDRQRRGGVLGSVIGGASRPESLARKGKGGKGRG